MRFDARGAPRTWSPCLRSAEHVAGLELARPRRVAGAMCALGRVVRCEPLPAADGPRGHQPSNVRRWVRGSSLECWGPSNFEKLVLRSIKADFCKQTLILQNCFFRDLQVLYQERYEMFVEMFCETWRILRYFLSFCQIHYFSRRRNDITHRDTTLFTSQNHVGQINSSVDELWRRGTRKVFVALPFSRWLGELMGTQTPSPDSMGRKLRTRCRNSSLSRLHSENLFSFFFFYKNVNHILIEKLRYLKTFHNETVSWCSMV